MDRARLIKIVASIVVALIVLLLPRETFGIEGLTGLQQRTMAVFVLAMFFWILEPIPIFATSVMVIVLELLAMSNKAPSFLRPEETLDYKAVMANFADPIIMLFLGGLFIGAAATKYRLDINLGRVLMRPFGTKPRWVMLGMMVATALFSMFMSNTATTAMMLAVLMPVLRAIDPDDPARLAFTLSIPFAANIGGIGTPIGTPPNAVVMKYLNAQLFDSGSTSTTPLISFAGWMVFAVPFVIVLLLITWVMLTTLFKPRAESINVNFEGRWLRSPRAWVVYITSIVTVVMWLLSGPLGTSSTVVAMIPVGVFCITGVMDSSDLKKISWDILWLMAGGFALGMALQKSGLANALVTSIPFGSLSPLLVVLVACGVMWVMAGVMSNTATANLITPVMAALAVGLKSLNPLGGPVMLLLAVTFCASLSMPLPISTPPNAMAYATGWVDTKAMSKGGLIIGVVGLALLAGMLVLLSLIGYFDRFGAATP